MEDEHKHHHPRPEPPTHDDIAHLAYKLWEDQGSPIPGDEVGDWLKAEKELWFWYQQACGRGEEEQI